jgi:hypothetical protein
MAQPITIPGNAYIIPVNLSSTWKTFTLPVVSTNAGRILIFKDMFGTAANSTLRLSTIGLDRIERSNVSSLTLSNTFGAWTFMNDGLTNWFLTNAYTNTFPLIESRFTNPASIAGIQAWFDGSDSSTVTLSGTTVTQWRDKSGFGNNTNARGGTTTFTTNAINGLSALSFNNSWFTGPFATTFSGNQVRALAVASLTTGSGAYGRIFSIGRPGVNDFNATDTTFLFCRNTGQNLMVGRNGSYLTVNLPAYSTPFLAQSGHNAATESIGLNGTLTPSTQNTGVAGNFNVTSYGIGTNANSGDATYWAGFIAEIIYYTTNLSTTQIQLLEGYLAWKWGLQGLLPSGHPWKNRAP